MGERVIESATVLYLPQDYRQNVVPFACPLHHEAPVVDALDASAERVVLRQRWIPEAGPACRRPDPQGGRRPCLQNEKSVPVLPLSPASAEGRVDQDERRLPLPPTHYQGNPRRADRARGPREHDHQ